MTIWVFGDSFTELEHNVDTCLLWTQLLANSLNTDQKNYARGGTGLEYTYEKVNEQYKNFSKGDVLIIGLTHHARQYFFADNPTYSTLSGCINAKKLTLSQNLAFKYFYQYLFNPSLALMHLTHFLYFLNFISREKMLTTIIIPCFPEIDEHTRLLKNDFNHIHTVIGDLMTVSECECSSKEIKDRLLNNELRSNHLCKSNHKLLFHKIFNGIQNNEIIDLTYGFKTGIINTNTINDMNFSSSEFS